MDLSGGLNTKRDPHAIQRNELALSQNTWYGSENAISKRPGTTAIVTGTGATGNAVSGTGLGSFRYNNVSYVLSQQGTILNFAALADASWSTFSGGLASGAGRIHVAQMYDPTSGGNAVFVCDGKDTPLYFTPVASGSTATLSTVTTTSGYLPLNFTGSAPITPRYVITDGQNSNLVYAGEPTYPGAVYISDPFFPQKFSFSATSTSSYPGTYSPYLIGQNDGVNGGDITGLCKLGTTIVVFKQAAIYFMQLQSVYGDLVFTDYCVSASTGCVAPESIVAFDQFACFLGNDGAYTVDIYGNIQQISRNVPTFFDNTLSGFVAECTSPTTATATRQGSRCILFYDNLAAGYPTSGLWFDFAKPDKDGLPTVGEIIGYSPAACVQLKGPSDDGNFVWTDATQDRIGKFGIGFSDFGSAISWSGNLKADILDDQYGPSAPVSPKALVSMWFDLSIPQQTNGATISMIGNVTTDYETTTTQAAQTVSVVVGGTAYYGSAHYGQDHYTSARTQTFQYATPKRTGLQADQGRTVQLGWTESSTNPVTILGITGEYDFKNVQGSP
jgi:hypothetical protein